MLKDLWVLLAACWLVCSSAELRAQCEIPADASFTSERAAGLSPEIEEGFHQTIRPLLTSYCLDCHGNDDPEGMLDLSIYDRPNQIVEGFDTWSLLKQRVADQEMPPRDSGYYPSDQERQHFVDWIDQLRGNTPSSTTVIRATFWHGGSVAKNTITRSAI
jgi:hypothetical protein